MSACMHAQVWKTRCLEGMLPQERIDGLRLLLWAFLNRSRAVVASYSRIQLAAKPLCSHMTYISTTEQQKSKCGEIVCMQRTLKICQKNIKLIQQQDIRLIIHQMFLYNEHIIDLHW